MQPRTREETLRHADRWLSKLRKTEEGYFEESQRRADEGEAADFWKESNRIMKQADDIQECLQRAAAGQETDLDFTLLEFAAIANESIEELNLREAGMKSCDAPYADGSRKG